LELAPGGDPDLARQVVHRVVGEDSVVIPESGRLHVPLEQADRATDMLIALRHAGIGVASLSVMRPTLDEVFLAITGHDTGQRDAPEIAEHELAPALR
jgi:ABC-2 type transport system ATP-binding protein